MPAVLALVFSLLLASPVTTALTLPQIAALAGIVVKDLPAAIKTEKQLIAFMESPQFRAMAAANGEAAIKWQDRQMEF